MDVEGTGASSKAVNILPALHELDLNLPIDEGVDEAGGLQFRANQAVGNPVSFVRMRLNTEQLVALALTEARCKLGLGQVCYAPKTEQPRFAQLKTIPLEAKYCYHQLPQLVYVAYHWSATDKSD
ncbi:MAG: hypothetical protein Q9166_000846 [cf. Caloplaca sp. 2 TL-2023]